MTPSSYGLSHVKNEFSLVSLTHVSVRMARVREKVFRNSIGFRFNVGFVDWTGLCSFNLSVRRPLVSPIY